MKIIKYDYNNETIEYVSRIDIDNNIKNLSLNEMLEYWKAVQYQSKNYHLLYFYDGVDIHQEYKFLIDDFKIRKVYKRFKRKEKIKRLL